jgi:putative membrane protein insertion efficiency factor
MRRFLPMDYKKLPTDLAIILIRAYQLFISPLFTILGGRCIYKISCSQYAIHAFQTYSFGNALMLSAKRILSCNPLTASKKS